MKPIKFALTKTGMPNVPSVGKSTRRRLDFDPDVMVLIDRCHAAEECVRALITLIAGDQGEFLASHSHDWKRATEALLKP